MTDNLRDKKENVEAIVHHTAKNYHINMNRDQRLRLSTNTRMQNAITMIIFIHTAEYLHFRSSLND